MLSRVADSLYWMRRYMERAEHTARLLDVNLNLMLDHSAVLPGQRWRRILRSLRTPTMLTSQNESYEIVELLVFDRQNPSSISSCVAAARENARQVREQISTEMWQQINSLYLKVRETRIDEVWTGRPTDFFAGIKEGVHLFEGVTNATMNHGEGWDFIRVGHYLERAMATTALLDVHFGHFGSTGTEASSRAQFLDMIGVLRSCSSFEGYCKVYTAEFRPDRIAEFLLLNKELPRSIRFAAGQIEAAIESIAGSSQTRLASRLRRVAGRIHSRLEFAQIDEIFEEGITGFLQAIERECAEIHSGLFGAYIQYPLDSVVGG